MGHYNDDYGAIPVEIEKREIKTREICSRLDIGHAVDYTIPTEGSLGQLATLPREIRNMVYVFFGRTVRADARYDEPLSEQLRKCHLLNTGKALCVEFLQVFVRQTAFDYYPADCGPWSHNACTHRNFERFLNFINRRIGLGSYTRGVGFWFYCDVPWEWPNVPYRTLRVRARCQRLVPRTVNQLWEWHEELRIASKDLYIGIKHSSPGPSTLRHMYREHPDCESAAWYFEFDEVNIKLSVIDFEASIASLKKAIVHIQSQIDQQHILRLNNVPCWPHSPITKPSSPTKPDLCPTFLLELHTSTIDQVIGLWRAKEEQYSVHHLFDIAESWLSKKLGH